MKAFFVVGALQAKVCHLYVRITGSMTGSWNEVKGV